MAMQFGRNLLSRYLPASGRASMPRGLLPQGVRKFSNGVQSRPEIESPLKHILPPLPAQLVIFCVLIAKPFLDPEIKVTEKYSEINRVSAEVNRLKVESEQLRDEKLALMNELSAERKENIELKESLAKMRNP